MQLAAFILSWSVGERERERETKPFSFPLEDTIERVGWWYELARKYELVSHTALDLDEEIKLIAEQRLTLINPKIENFELNLNPQSNDLVNQLSKQRSDLGNQGKLTNT